MDYVELRNGIKIPAVGFGPAAAGYSPKYSTRTNNIVLRGYNKIIRRPFLYKDYVKSVANAINIGFNLIDYSASYGDGLLIRKAIDNSRYKRENLVLTTRVSNQAQFNNSVEKEFFTQLENFGVDYFDILMFHWPVTELYVDTWKKMIDLQKKGYVKTLGVANCKQHHLDRLIKETGEVPMINQIEVHPLFTQKDLISYCSEKGILVEAYTPIARFDDRLMRSPILNDIAKKYNKTITQIILRWHIQNGVVPVVRTLSYSHQKENVSVFDFELSREEMSIIDGININSRLRYDADNCDFRIL